MKSIARAVVFVSLTFIGSAAWPVDPPLSSASDHPTCIFVDLTDPSLKAELAKRNLIGIGLPIETRSTTGKTRTKISRGKFLAFDQNGDSFLASIECTMTCTGNECSQLGCTAENGACTAWNCGVGCTGSCTSKSIGQLDSRPESPQEKR